MPRVDLDDLHCIVELARGIFETRDLIIAGGAPRDILSGIDPKDIDIFVRVTEAQIGRGGDLGLMEITDGKPSRDSWFCKTCEKFAVALGYCETVSFIDAPEDYGNVADIANINSERYGMVQVVAITEDPVDDIVNYDFSLSQVFVTGAALFQTLICGNDRHARRITFTGNVEEMNENAIKRSIARLARLRAKYSSDSWIFVNCDVLDAEEQNLKNFDAMIKHYETTHSGIAQDHTDEELRGK
jgi:hypothetical protein